MSPCLFFAQRLDASDDALQFKVGQCVHGDKGAIAFADKDNVDLGKRRRSR